MTTRTELNTPFLVGREAFEIKVPASIANLGPGFDTLAVAVQLYLRLRVWIIGGHGRLQFRFVDHELRGENNIERAFRFLAGQNPAAHPSLYIEVRSDIPMCAGLGSSAAATVAGLRLYEALNGPLPVEAIVNAACALETHPDNASAACLGGLTTSCQLPDGSVFATSFPWPETIAFVVVTPDVQLATAESRKVLPSFFPRRDVVFNLQRLSLLLQSLQSGNFSLLKEALRDRLHQPVRREIVPGLAQALELEHEDLLGVCLSGSGPSIVGLAQTNLQTIAELLASIYESLGIGYQLRTLTVHQDASGRPQNVFARPEACSSPLPVGPSTS
ncbi:MAG: homoserine kinase [Candidatus Korobacteraceae bacterium]